MPRIHKILTTSDVAILSLLSEGENHGYGLNELIEYRGFRNWTDIGFSSIYAILTRLENTGLITSRLNFSRKGPARKLYKLTQKGKRALLKAIRHYISEPERPRSRVDLGAAYIELLPIDEAIACLESYRRTLLKRLEDMEKTREQQSPLPFGAEIIFDHGRIRGRAEIEWIDRVLKRLKQRKKGG